LIYTVTVTENTETTVTVGTTANIVENESQAKESIMAGQTEIQMGRIKS